MKIEQRQWTENQGWTPNNPAALSKYAQVLFVFGNRKALQNKIIIDQLRKDYPEAHICGCSTAGEIKDVNVTDEALVATAVKFDKTKVEIARIKLSEVNRSSFQAGAKLAESLNKPELVHVFVLSDAVENIHHLFDDRFA